MTNSTEKLHMYESGWEFGRKLGDTVVKQFGERLTDADVTPVGAIISSNIVQTQDFMRGEGVDEDLLRIWFDAAIAGNRSRLEEFGDNLLACALPASTDTAPAALLRA